MRTAINIATSYARYLLGLLAVALLTPYILDKVGVEAYGLWALCLAVTGVLGLLDLGLNTAAVKFVAECAGNGRAEARNEALTTLLVVYVGLGLLILGLVQLVIPAGISWFSLAAEDAAQFRTLLSITGAVIAAGLPLSLFRSALVGQGRWDIVNTVDVVVIALNVVLTLVLLHAGMGLMGLAAANAFMVLAPSLIMIPIAFGRIPQLAVRPGLFKLARLRQTASLAGWFMLANIALLVTLRSDTLLIKAFLPLSAVAAFAVAAKIAEFAYLLNKQFSNALMPLVSRSHGAGDERTIRLVLVDGTRILTLVSAPVLTLLLIHAKPIILLWVGPALMEAVLPLQILLCAVFFSTLQFNAANVLGMAGRHRWVALTLVSSAAVNIFLTTLLLPRLGLPGAALATLAAAVSIELLLMLGAAFRQHGVPAGSFLGGLSRIAPALAGMCLVAFGLSAFAPAESLPGLSLQCVVAGAVYLLLAFYTALNGAERHRATDWVRKRTQLGAVPAPATDSAD